MYVCLCNGVTEQDIRRAMDGGCASMSELTMRTGCGANCGCCVDVACAMLDESARRAGDNVIAFPAVARAA